MVSLLKDTTFYSELFVQESSENMSKILLFKNGNNRYIYILWTYDETQNENGSFTTGIKTINMTVKGNIDNILNIYNEALNINRTGDILQIEILSFPIYMVGNFEIEDLTYLQ